MNSSNPSATAAMLSSPKLEDCILMHPPAVEPHTPLSIALQRMNGIVDCVLEAGGKTSAADQDLEYLKRNIGCVLVVEKGTLQGILTERDIVRLAMGSYDFEHIPVAEVMTSPVLSLPHKDFTDLFVVYNLMRRHQIRHLPIVNEQERVAGLITMSSLRRNLSKGYFLRFRQVGEIMTAQVVTVLPTDFVSAAVQRMATYKISCVVVVQPHTTSETGDHPGQIRNPHMPIGILTERDILQLKTLNLNLDRIVVQDVMSTPLTCVNVTDTLEVVQDLMQKLHVRRLVVTATDGSLLGIVTETNLTKVLDPLELYGIVEILQMQVSTLTESRNLLLQSRNFDLEQGFSRQEFELVYQPQLDLRTQRILGAEVLLRWYSPREGPIPPSEFIPWAEKTNFILKLGYWVLETACKQVRAWQQGNPQVFGDLSISVNLSSKQLMHPSFLPELMAILEKTKLLPQYLKLELTESVLVENFSVAAEKFKQLKALGIQVAIDDFGTGYASLSYLQHFSFDILKIDRSFIQDIDQNLRNQAIVNSILRLAQQLNFQVIAEGVETWEEQAFLASRDCPIIQGFWVSKPLDAAAWSRFMANYSL